MALELRDVRAKLDPDTHKKLSIMALSTNRDIGDLLREAVEQYVRAEIEKAHSYKVMLTALREQGSERE